MFSNVSLDWLPGRIHSHIGCTCLTFYRTQVNLGSDLWVQMSVSEGRCVDLTDVTLADEDTNSILTDNAKRAIQGNETMQVMKTNASGGQICN